MHFLPTYLGQSLTVGVYRRYDSVDGSDRHMDCGRRKNRPTHIFSAIFAQILHFSPAILCRDW